MWTKYSLYGGCIIVKPLQGSRSRSCKGQGHKSLLPIAVKHTYPRALKLECRVGMECRISWRCQGQGHTKVKVTIAILSAVAKFQDLFAKQLEYRLGMKWKSDWRGQGQGQTKIKVTETYFLLQLNWRTYLQNNWNIGWGWSEKSIEGVKVKVIQRSRSRGLVFCSS